jgi:hypothetical protein
LRACGAILVTLVLVLLPQGDWNGRIRQQFQYLERAEGSARAGLGEPKRCMLVQFHAMTDEFVRRPFQGPPDPIESIYLSLNEHYYSGWPECYPAWSGDAQRGANLVVDTSTLDWKILTGNGGVLTNPQPFSAKVVGMWFALNGIDENHPAAIRDAAVIEDLTRHATTLVLSEFPEAMAARARDQHGWRAGSRNSGHVSRVSGTRQIPSWEQTGWIVNVGSISFLAAVVLTVVWRLYRAERYPVTRPRTYDSAHE